MNQLVCRCCLLEQPRTIYNLFENQLREKLMTYVPHLHIEHEDGLSEVICDVCYLNLDNFIQFVTKCQASEVELRKRYEDTNKAIDEVLRCTVSSFDNIDELLLEDYIFSDIIVDDVEAQNQSDPFIDEFLHDVLENLDFDEILTNEDGNGVDKINIEHSAIAKTTTLTQTSSTTTLPPIPTKVKEINKLTTTTRVNDKTTKPTTFGCLLCGKNFTRNFQLKLHQNSVHNTGVGLPYKCNECKKEFASRSSLNYHYKSLHSTDRPFNCIYCSRQFVLRTQLASHLRIHTGEIKPRTHECQVCGKFWPTKSDLRLHMRSHNPHMERPFKCDRCDKRFYSRGHLQSHILVHTGEKPFNCIFCQKSYQSIGNLNNHIVRHHADLMVS